MAVLRRLTGKASPWLGGGSGCGSLPPVAAYRLVFLGSIVAHQPMPAVQRWLPPNYYYNMWHSARDAAVRVEQQSMLVRAHSDRSPLLSTRCCVVVGSALSSRIMSQSRPRGAI